MKEQDVSLGLRFLKACSLEVGELVKRGIQEIFKNLSECL